MAAAGVEPDSSSAAVTVATPPPSSPPPPAAMHPSNDSDENNPSGRVLTLALPIQHPLQPSKSPSPAPAARVGPPIREDCWSEGATSALIDAWGERYLHLNRGNLRRSDWQEVADAVSSREDYTKPPKSDAQCKNRIDTLKKKYKQEISKRSSSGSNWIFFDRLHNLIGGNPNPAPPKPTSSRIRLPAKRPPPPPAKSPPPPPSEDESSEGFPPPPPPPPPIASTAQQKKRGKGGEIRDIMRAVMRFVEIYEKAEKEKMVAEAEVEKRRLEFEKEIQVQRVQFFLRAQTEIDRMGSSGGRRRGHGGRQWGRRASTGGRGNTSTSNNNDNEMSEDSNQ